MSVKMIAVDMDGTFLNSQNDYDRALFQTLYQQMQQQNVKFVVASGNQYYQLHSFFPEIADELSFVAENGAYVVSEGVEVACAEMPLETVHEILAILDTYEEVHTILCGKNSAYASNKEPQAFIDHGSIYYHRLKQVDDLYAITDDILFKFALSCPVEQAPEILEKLTTAFAGKITPVSSGHGDIDLIIPGVHKAQGLKTLQKIWQIEDTEVAAFGDSGNDLEMLEHAGYSYAMCNAQPAVKAVASAVIATNDQNGVLLQVGKLLEE